MIKLGEVLKGDVPESGTVREQIEYIDIALIDSDPNNFYELSDLDGLAANIELCGLQQPIRVRTNPDDPTRVIIVSGHRRRAAIEQLVNEGREDLREIPCIREQRTGSAALQELQLIYANSDTRKMSNADVIRQVERVTELLYQLKEEGIEFPGRMRDHVAEACKISKSKISRLKVVRDKLDPIWMPAFEAGALNEAVAYALAQLPPVHQRIIYLKKEQRGDKPENQVYEHHVAETGRRLAQLDALACPGDGGACVNCDNKHARIVHSGTYEYVPCTGCCSDCQQLAHCKMACPKLAERIAILKADEKERQKQAQVTQEQIEKPIRERIQAYWSRFGEARVAAGKSWEECCKAVSVGSWSHGGERGAAAKEAGEEPLTVRTLLPYGYSCDLSDIRNIVAVADLFGCSLDYLLCRTDEPGRLPADEASGDQVAASRSGGMWYPAAQLPDEGQEIVVVTEEGFASDETYKKGALWASALHWTEVRYWAPMPDYETGEVQEAGQQMMLCSWMPAGTTPAEPCEVLAVFDLGSGGRSRQFLQWTGTEFVFKNGAKIEMEPIKWMRLPPEDVAHEQE